MVDFSVALRISRAGFKTRRITYRCEKCGESDTYTSTMPAHMLTHTAPYGPQCRGKLVEDNAPLCKGCGTPEPFYVRATEPYCRGCARQMSNDVTGSTGGTP